MNKLGSRHFLRQGNIIYFFTEVIKCKTMFVSFINSKVGFKEVMMAASAIISCGNMKQVEEIAKDLIAYNIIFGY